MVDFKKLRESKKKPKPIHPREIFNSLPKPPGINDLYASQAEVLDDWFGRRTDLDVVIKLHTGGGKTLVALLMAQSVMNELGEPVIYLAPTNQLVDQVIAKSQEYGIPTVRYVRGQTLANEFFDGEAVLVGAYETLFNGRSKFGVRNSGQGVVKAGTIILDVAHVARSSVRVAFSLTIEAAKHPEVYADLAGRFRTAFREIGRSGSFADITGGKDYGVIEVPSWAWQQKLSEIESYLAPRVDAIDPYVWPFLRDNLSVCHCLFTGRSVTITPIFPRRHASDVRGLPTQDLHVGDDSRRQRDRARIRCLAGCGWQVDYLGLACGRRRTDDPHPRAHEAWWRADPTDGQEHRGPFGEPWSRGRDPDAVVRPPRSGQTQQLMRTARPR